MGEEAWAILFAYTRLPPERCLAYSFLGLTPWVGTCVSLSVYLFGHGRAINKVVTKVSGSIGFVSSVSSPGGATRPFLNILPPRTHQHTRTHILSQQRSLSLSLSLSPPLSLSACSVSITLRNFTIDIPTKHSVATQRSFYCRATHTFVM